MRILVRLPNWLGDAVMSSAFLRGLAANFPDADIQVILKQELRRLAPFLPFVNRVHLFSKKEYPGLTGAWRFGRQLRHEAFDLYFSLPDSFSAAVTGFAARAGRRVGYRKELRSLLLTDAYAKTPGIHRVRDYAGLLEKFTGKPVAPEVRLQRTAADVSGSPILVNFNSEASSRRMPVEKARRILTALTQAFPMETFVCIGAPFERAYIESILNGPQLPVKNLAGTTDLEGLCRLMCSARALVTTDSGPAHLANAFGLPTVVLFGAGNEYHTAPFQAAEATVIRAGKLPCEPCVKNTCPLYAVPECMNLLEEAAIIRALQLYLPDVTGRG